MDKRKRRLLCMLEGSGWKSRWISGVPPLSFKAKKAGVLENYRIYGNTVGGESVGDRTGNLFDGEVEQGSFHGGNGGEMPSPTRIRTTFCTKSIPAGTYTINAIGITNVVGYSYITNNTNSWDSSNSFMGWKELPYTFTLSAERFMRFAFKQSTDISVQPSDISNIMLNAGSIPLPYEPYGYKVQIAVTNSGTTSNETIYLPEPIKMVGDEAEYIDYGEQKQHRVRKNLLQNTVTSTTVNGVAFTANSDGSVTCNGTANGGTALFWVPTITLPAGQYSINGCPAGGTESTTYKILILANNVWLINDTGSGANFTLTETSTVSVRIAIYNGYTCNNLTFYPMIRKADIEDDTYEPYIENTDLDVTLPALPTLTGTNVLSVGTAVQPSEIEVKGKIKAL